jgi:hypothetical protein
MATGALYQGKLASVPSGGRRVEALAAEPPIEQAPIE